MPSHYGHTGHYVNASTNEPYNGRVVQINGRFYTTTTGVLDGGSQEVIQSSSPASRESAAIRQNMRTRRPVNNGREVMNYSGQSPHHSHGIPAHRHFIMTENDGGGAVAGSGYTYPTTYSGLEFGSGYDDIGFFQSIGDQTTHPAGRHGGHTTGPSPITPTPTSMRNNGMGVARTVTNPRTAMPSVAPPRRTPRMRNNGMTQQGTVASSRVNTRMSSGRARAARRSGGRRSGGY
tara:strand:- start:1638 stop:2339 length:702 start_codon:yes stop_codon:yes gene_type:complete